MTLDDRLHRAFSNLETRVNEKLAERPTPDISPEPTYRPSDRTWKILAPIAAAVVLLVAIGAAALLLRNQPDPVPPAGEVTTTTAAPGTTVPPPETSLPPTTQAPPPTTEAPTTTVPTDAFPADAFAGVTAVRAGADGVVAHGAGGATTLVDAPAVAAYHDGRGGLVYQLGSFEGPGEFREILYVRPGDVEPQLLVLGEDEIVRLVGVFDVQGEPHVAFTVTSGSSESRRDTLRMLGLDTLGVLDLGEVGFFEVGLIDVSVAGEVVVIQTSGEGIVQNEARTLDGEPKELLNAPELECAFIGVGGQECLLYLNITDDGLRYVAVAWSELEGDAADLVVIEVGTGAEEHRVPIGEVIPRDVDVEWPYVVVNTRSDIGAPADAYLVDFSDPGSSRVTALPGVGVAGAVRPL